jgi:hypothetical protein
MRHPRDFAKIRAASGADLRLLVEATLWLGLSRIALLTIPFSWTTRLFALTPGKENPPVDRQSRERARRIGWAVGTAGARTPWRSTCLAQALAGSGMLRLRRIPTTMAMGVAKSCDEPGGGLEAHAWLSCAGSILTGARGHERYRVIAQFTPGRR